MHAARWGVLALAAFASTARAEPTSAQTPAPLASAAPEPAPAAAASAPQNPEARPAEAEPSMAVMVNPPLFWAFGGFGLTFLRALADHHAVRVNVAHYRHFDLIDTNALLNETPGTRTDLGVSWSRSFTKRWSGPVLDLGPVVRQRSHPLDRERTVPTESESYELAARVMLGWSWIFRGRFVAAVGLGASLGYERGTRWRHHDDGIVEERFSGGTFSYEGYSRLGVAFGR
jgi:hypothetical protein